MIKIIIRRSVPPGTPVRKVIVRKSLFKDDNISIPQIPQVKSTGGWIYKEGFPPNPGVKTYHSLEYGGTTYAYLWDPSCKMWISGDYSKSPGVVARDHRYVGLCSLVTFTWREPNEKSYRRK